MNDDVYQRWCEIAAHRLDRDGFGALPTHLRATICVREVEGAVCGGGFKSYYDWECGDRAADAPAAIRVLGTPEAEAAAAVVEQANAAFGPAGPPRDFDRREAAVDALPKDAADRWDAADEAFYKVCGPLEEQLRATLARFELPADL